MKWKILFASLSVVCIASFSTQSVSAASEFDTTYQQAEALIISSNSYAGLCEPVDISSNWATYIHNSGRATSFQNALNNGSWAVHYTEQKAPYQVANEVKVYWHETERMSLQFNDGGTIDETRLYATSGNIHMQAIANDWAGWDSSPNCNISAMNNRYVAHGLNTPFTTSGTHENQGYTIKGFLAANVDVTYPPDYAGAPITDTYTPPPETIDYFTPPWLVVDNVGHSEFGIDLAKMLRDNLPELNGANGDTTTITLENSAGKFLTTSSEFDPATQFYLPVLDGINSTEYILNYDPSLTNGMFGYDLIRTRVKLPFDTYQLTVIARQPNNENLIDGKLPIYKESKLKFEVNGKPIRAEYIGDDWCLTGNGQNCETGAPTDQDPTTTLTGQVPAESCDFGDFSCILTNWLSELWNFIVALFVPSYDPNNKSPFEEFSTNTHGIASIIVAPLEIFHRMSSASYSCAPIDLSLPFINKTLSLPCLGEKYQQNYGALYTMWQTVILGIVSYYIVVDIFRITKDIKNPRKDQIEVTAL